MALNPEEFDRIVTLERHADGAEPVLPETAPAPTPEAAPATAAELVAPQTYDLAAPAPATFIPALAPSRTRKRPGWVVPAAIAAVGLIASGTLGYFFYDTSTKLNATRQHLAATQASLEATKLQLTGSQEDAAGQKAIKEYEALVLADAGKVDADYNQVQLCNSYSTCRTWAQQTLGDMQSFQSDRRTLAVPSQFSSIDSQYGDGLSAGIAALNELINGMDTDNVSKIRDGFKKLEGAMLTIAKAETALGSQAR